MSQNPESQTSAFKERSSGGQFVLEMPGVVTLYVAKSAMTRIYSLDPNEVSEILIDFSRTDELKSTSYPAFVSIRLHCREKKMKLLSGGAADAIRSQIHKAGLDIVFGFDSPAAPQRLPSESKTFNSQRLNASAVNGLIEAGMYCARQVFNLECTAGKPYLKTGETFSGLGLFGIITLNSDLLRGFLRISMPQEFVLKLLDLLEPGRVREIDSAAMVLMEDGMQSLYAQAKSKLVEFGIDMERPIANVLVGTLMSTSSTERTVLVMPFESKLGQFYIELEIHN